MNNPANVPGSETHEGSIVSTRGRALFLFVVGWTFGCGPNVSEAPEPAGWMMGVFSSQSPTEWTERGAVTQYRVHDDFEVEVINLISAGSTSHYLRTWEPRGDDVIVMYPADDELGSTTTEYLLQPTQEGTPECGPYEVLDVWGPEATQPGPKEYQSVIRGAVCPRSLSPCPEEPVEGRREPCGGYAMEWCDKPPPPCDAK